MKIISSKLNIPFLRIIILMLTASSLAHAQNDDICKEGDCSPEVFNVTLDEPLNPISGSYSSERTENFIQAYKSFQLVKSVYANSPSWKIKFESSQLSGKSCLRHYQLESRFGSEYSQNSDFKKFIDANASNADSFEKDGFKNARKGNNLKTRMTSKCPEEVKESEKGTDPKDLPIAFQKLGTKLGYFDKEGNILKSFEESSFIPDLTKLSKKKQIEALKRELNNLPLDQDLKNKLDNIKSGLDLGGSNLGIFNKAMGLLNTNLESLLPLALNLFDKIKSGLGILDPLLKFKPKKSVPELLSNLENLLKKGNGLSDKATALNKKANSLKESFNQLSQKGANLEDKLKNQTDKIADLEKKLKSLQDKKEELSNKLADKPKKILDELKLGVNDLIEKAKDLTESANQQNELKDKILKEIEALNKEKEALKKELEQTETDIKDLAKEQIAFEKESKELKTELENLKKKEDKLETLKKELNDLKAETEIEAEIADCETELKNLLNKINGLDTFQKNLEEKKKGIFSIPAKLTAKISEMKLVQEVLRLGKKGIPLVDKALSNVDQLISKTVQLTKILEAITGKEIAIDEKISNYGEKLNNIKAIYENKISTVDNLKKELLDLITEKSGLKDGLEDAQGNLDQMDNLVNDFVKRYNIFDEKSKCFDKGELDEKIEDLKAEHENLDPELDGIENELKDVNKEAESLESETKKVQQEIEADLKRAEEEAEKLIKEEEAIKKEYGTDIKLEPVTIEEWSESFEVTRPYWDAVFHPDDEVVEGFKGRYFEVRLKDAEKEVKLLFGPGEYFKSKSAFRKNYGSTIGAFVTEALHTMKQADQDQVKLFIQGSADIVGHKTFSGRQNDQFLFSEITILPQKGSEDSFGGQAILKTIPKTNFRNEHLPDLRAQYLSQMTSIYSKKFDPIILEGAVKKFKDEEERNAIIYLFIPESIIMSNE